MLELSGQPLTLRNIDAIGAGQRVRLALSAARQMAASLRVVRDVTDGDALRLAGMEPVRLQAKEGLALLNGTQALTAVGALALWRAHRLVGLADVSGALTLEALLGTRVAFDQRIHAARPHAGQAVAARRLRTLLAESRTMPVHIQDAYSLRCMP